jgi:hypothetical protein
MILRNVFIIGGLWLVAATPAVALDGNQIRFPRPVTALSSVVSLAAMRASDRSDYFYGWAEIQALRAFTRMH